MSIPLPLALLFLAAPQVAQEPVVEWSFGGLEIEGEPRVERERVVLAGRDPTGRRALCVLDLASGHLQARALFAADAPLEPALAGERIAIRAGPARVEVLQLRGSRLVSARSFQHRSSVSAPLLSGDELYLREGDELVRHDLGRRESTWRAQVQGAFRGAPVLSGERLFCAWFEPSGLAHVAELERAGGGLRADVVLGTCDASPGEAEPLELVVHAENLFAALPRPLAATSGQAFPWARVPLEEHGFGGPVSLHAFVAPPLEIPGGWIAPERPPDDAGVRWLCVRRERDGERAIELASPAHHRWLSAVTAPGSRAGETVHLGPSAARLATFELLWRRAAAPEFRPVPAAGGRLLVVEDGLLGSLAQPRPEPAPAEVRAAETARELEHRLAEQLAQLATKALRSGDLALAERLVLEAEAGRARGRGPALARSELDRLSASPRAPVLDPRKRSAVLEEERSIRARVPDALCDVARASREPELCRAYLRQLFTRQPEHGRGLEILGALLPANASALSGSASAWLDFLDVSARLPIEIVAPPPPGPGTRRAEGRLAEERERWRADALGFRSPRLFVVSAAASPGAIARALETGELVCDVLEETFGRAAGAEREPLELVLYPTREEYLEHSGRDLGGLERVLGWTAGHFDLQGNVSRMYLPEDDLEHARLLGVYAHELAHHWLSARSSFGPPRAKPQTGGFWITEAIATWAEELALDPRRGTWSAENARAPSLDTLAGAEESELLPWSSFLALSGDEFQRLDNRPSCSLELAWQLGARADRSPLQLAYAQGGALAHWLFRGEGGARRELLLRAVESFYRGEAADLPGILGLSPQELGARVQAFARSAVEP